MDSLFAGLDSCLFVAIDFTLKYNSGVLASTASAAWNDEDLTPSYLFYMHVQGGVSCTRCKGNESND